MSRTGRRVLFTAPDTVAVEPMAVPEPGPGEILIETRATLISPGTETAELQNQSSNRGGYPRYPGYSHAGVVLAVGEGVTAFSPGQRVYSQAPHGSHVRLNASNPTLLSLPDPVPFAAATFTTLFAVALYAVRRAEVQIGESVLILGAGLVGQLALKLVGLRGAAAIVVADTRAGRLRYCRGADLTVDPRDEAERRAAMDMTYRGEGFDVVIDATGNAAVLPDALAWARRRGRVVLLGSPHGAVQLENLFAQLDSKDISLLGAHQPNNPQIETLGWPWSQRRERALILELLARGRLDVAGLPIEHAPPEAAAAAYARLVQRDEDVLSFVFEW